MTFDERDDHAEEPEAVDASSLGDEDEETDDDEEDFGRHGMHIEGEDDGPPELR